MRGLLMLGSRPGFVPGIPQLQNHQILSENAADYAHPPLFLSRSQQLLSRLMDRCEWVCVWAEGDAAACGLILSAQFSVDRLILVGDHAFGRHPDRRQRRLNAFARGNLSLITAEIIAAGMGERTRRRLSSGLGWHGRLLCLADGAELWQKRETFLTAPFEALPGPFEP